ncbi:dynamin family protein [Virgibacillus sp. NKC19-16]|uniref:dynamin family protein n=1 Tax=Virgibacillus salidurans TaxID=2831673 RepID=UPI001F351BED|nr:dynamin family protein [Virgibacillus sp. NKC19-16]UJL48041.1 dynamin family protein [Virgibacillus sp. NKC19-16]
MLNVMQTHVRLQHIVALHKVMINNNDKLNAAKMMDIYEKIEKGELAISFAGHFSAGKSSMINALLGEDILPKSPIPTSANVVKINSGEGVARVFFKHSQPVEYTEPYDMDRIKAYSMEKDSIEKIEISTGKRVVPEDAAIIDTPGIDAANDADRLMTEASLHLVDVLFYVMDYNHVQSEVNLHFLKSLQQKRIPFYVIINQIDKHDEEEIRFEAFAESIKQTFDQWGLFPKNIFYSSLVYSSSKYNQFEEIKQILFSMMSKNKEAFLNNDNAVQQIMKDHKHFLKTQYDDLIDVTNEPENNVEEMGAIEAKLTQLKNESAKLEKDFQHELQNTLNNAYLMPASIRDKAKVFLQSQQKDFKVGLLATKKKTAEEKKKRSDAFLASLQENIEASVQWKLQDKFIQLVKSYDMNDQQLQKFIQDLSITYTHEDLMRLIKSGAKVNGDYILNYTSDVAADIKQQFRKSARSLWEFIHQVLTNKNEEVISAYEERFTQLQEAQALKIEQDMLQAELKVKYSHIDKQFRAPDCDEEAWRIIQNERKSKQKQPISRIDTPKQNQNITVNMNDEPAEVETKVKSIQSIEPVLESVSETLEVIGDLPGFQTLMSDLKDKQHRLTNRTYTIALFGAFSAGKSSFANALLGESVLPVSPNPTTAAVNRICPITSRNKHGTVDVRLKDRDVLRKDILSVTKNFSPPDMDVEALLQWVQDKGIHQNPQLNKMYQSYLQALISGFPENKNSIGKTVTITVSEFTKYVTDETKACYIELIDLYYDCSLTRQGITLVDTPGADSVNARHTNVAFNYIKHADAILYVTYYNHALSRADKDFLMQLGRVKEAFQLDKMFFVVNAADLAVDDEELTLVTQYVQEQLIELGIRLPRVYPLSSKLALKSKQSKQDLNEQMQQFEDSFYHFIHNDLSLLTVEATLWDIKRVYQTLKHYMESLHLDQKEKNNRKHDLLSKKDTFTQKLTKLNTDIYKDQIAQKIEKQLFYVLERLAIRYHDIFKESFNPTTITESGRKAQYQLRNALQNLIDYVGFELLQEVQAVSLRVEATIQSHVAEVYGKLVDSSKEVEETFSLPNFDQVELVTPPYKRALQEIVFSEFDNVFAMYNGTKAFFVKNEKAVMKEQLYTVLEPYEKQYIDENKLIMNKTYLEQWDKIIENIKQEAIENIDAQINNYLEIMESSVDMERLTEKLHVLDRIIDQHAIGDVQ